MCFFCIIRYFQYVHLLKLFFLFVTIHFWQQKCFMQPLCYLSLFYNCQDSFKICTFKSYFNYFMSGNRKHLKSFWKIIGSNPLLYQLIHVLPVIINPLRLSLCFWTEMKQCLLMQSASISYYLGSWPFMYQVTLSYDKAWHCIKRRIRRGDFWMSGSMTWNQTYSKTFQNDFILKVL